MLLLRSDRAVLIIALTYEMIMLYVAYLNGLIPRHVSIIWPTTYIQLYSPECTLAENININNNKQNKDRNILINTVQLNICYTFVNVLTKDITEDALGKFPHEFRTLFL